MSEWETFCDECYYHLWRVRRKSERGFNDGFHLQHGEEAKALVDLLNRLERERAEAREDLEFRRGLYKVQEECLDRAKRERDEAQAQVKLANTPKTDAYQYADYILNHYDRNSHKDKLCLAKSLVENGYGSKAAGWEEAK